jgi:tetratricopeptide (TPR) repeat protein
MSGRFVAVIAILTALHGPGPTISGDRQGDALLSLIGQVQAADYKGDRAALMRFHEQLESFLGNKQLVSRVQYWRGFALWRRALNGFNESADPRELEADLEQAVQDFNESSAADPRFADAKIGAGSCLSNLMFLNRGNATRMKELIARAGDVLKQAKKEAPDNPRLYWVLGPNVWYAPPQRGGSQAAAMDLYKKGLDLIPDDRTRPKDVLDPSWGEPELLMNLAWSSLHQTKPDPRTAQSYAKAALKLVPYWHYVRDILMPQILAAIANGDGAAKSASSEFGGCGRTWCR